MSISAPDADYIFVGSGINSLVCAAMLAARGQRVLILERNTRPGGCIRTDALTMPGFSHDSLSSWYPAFLGSRAHAVLGTSLQLRGVQFVNSDAPLGVALDDGLHFLLRRDRSANVAAMNACSAGDGDRYVAMLKEFERVVDLFGQLIESDFSASTLLRDACRAIRKHGLAVLFGFYGASLQSARDLLDATFRSDLVKALLAPWALHAGLSPDAAGSALMMRLLPFSVELFGMPLVRGGSACLVDAFCSLITEQRGEVCTDTDVAVIEVHAGRATGVRTADGRRFMARRGVICNVTPGQLYGRLLPEASVPARIAAAASEFRHGRGCMQIHLALDRPPRWVSPELDTVAYLHVTDGLDGVSRAVNEATCGLLPRRSTIAVGHSSLVDPSRAPAGKSILWLQILDLPKRIRGDAAERIKTPADGRWNQDIREAYADRIMERLARLIVNLESSVLARRVLSPADLETMNVNLVGGDPFGGDCNLDQAMFCRPFKGGRAWRTPVANVFHIGASTHPGHNLGAGSGYGLAQRLA